MKTYRIEIPSEETAVTAATWDTSCAPVPQDFTHTDDSGFKEIVTDGHWAFDNNIIRFTASTNDTSSMREGYMTITYKVNGISCAKRTHLVQAAAGTSCSCSNITSFPDISNIIVPSTSPYSYTLSPYAENCDMYIENNNDWLTVTKSSNSIIFTANSATDSYRNGFVYIQTTQGGSVCKTLSVEQYPNDCTITFNMDEYQPNYIDPDFMVNSCSGTVGGAFVVYRKSDHNTEGQYCCNPDDNPVIEHTLRFLPDAEPNTTEDDRVYEYEYDGSDFNASHYEGVYIQAPCENPSTVCVRLGGYDSGYPDYDVNHHTWVEITDGSSKEYRSLTIEALIRTWNGSPDTYTEEWVTATAFHEYILHIVGSGDSAFQVGDQVISFRCGTVHGPNGTIPVDMSCSSGCN